MRLRVAPTLGLLAGTALLIAGCHSGGSSTSDTSSAVANAKASASAFATSPAVIHDETKALNQLTGCVNTASGGQLTFKVVTGGQGSASVPGTTSPPQVQLTHVSILLLHHFHDKFKGAVDCAVPPAKRAAVKRCVKHLSLPTSKATIQGYLIGVANCMVGAK